MVGRMNEQVGGINNKNAEPQGESRDQLIPSNKNDEASNNPKYIKQDILDNDESVDGDYHVRAGRMGGETTKQRHRDSNFYKQIGSLGGATTMARHGQEY